MKIAIISPSDEKVPPAKYGGTELVIYNLAEGLVKKGHEVHLFAAGDATTSATLHPTFPRSFRTSIANSAYPEDLRWFYNSVAIGKAAAEIAKLNVDIVHNHLGWRTLPFRAVMKAPVVTTMHGPYDIPFIPEFVGQYPDAKFVSISNSQAKLCAGLPFVGTVYNGIRVNEFEYGETPDNYLAFLGRICPDKGIKESILAAKAAGEQLIIAAKVDAVDREYYETEIKPLIDGTQIQFIGEVDHAGKVELLKRAKALMVLIQWDEPFGLVMAEALACGTPVIAVPRGSAPELVEHGKTGFHVANTTESAVQAIRKIHTIDRAVCRQEAEARFSAEVMVDGYLDVYRTVLAAERSAQPAKLPSLVPAQQAVEKILSKGVPAMKRA